MVNPKRQLNKSGLLLGFGGAMSFINRKTGHVCLWNRLRGVLVFALCLTVLVPTPLWARDNSEDTELSCEGPILANMPHDEVPAQVTQDASQVLAEIQKSCSHVSECTDEALYEATKVAIQKKGGPSQSKLRKFLRLPRRALTFLIWGGSILGSGVLSYYATAGVPDGLRISFSSFVMVMSGVLFGRFSSPFEKKIGPKIEQLAFWLYDPDPDDGWGQIMKTINEAERLEKGQILNQVIVLRPWLKTAAYALNRNDIRNAARAYVHAILHSVDLFGGLNLAFPATVREVRGYLPEQFKGISVETRTQLLEEALAVLRGLPDKELRDSISRKTLESIVHGSISYWFDLT